MSRNNLTGSIPEILASLPYLQFLDVSNNNLSRPLPTFSERVKFLHDNNRLLSQNDPSGQSKESSVPVGMLLVGMISGRGGGDGVTSRC